MDFHDFPTFLDMAGKLRDPPPLCASLVTIASVEVCHWRCVVRPFALVSVPGLAFSRRRLLAYRLRCALSGKMIITSDDSDRNWQLILDISSEFVQPMMQVRICFGHVWLSG